MKVTKVECSKKEYKPTLGELEQGDLFLFEDDDTVYMVTEEIQDYRRLPTGRECINPEDGSLHRFRKDNIVKLVTGELTWREDG